MPIFDDVGKYGLKTRHLQKHAKDVDRFYNRTIEGEISDSEVVLKYQKRFLRYRESLFRFLFEDGIPWNNNTGERAIRHLAIQRKISGSFYGVRSRQCQGFPRNPGRFHPGSGLSPSLDQLGAIEREASFL